MEKTKQNIRQKLAWIQAKLKAPKGQLNKFGNYRYRSAEDILEALKPLTTEVECSLVINDRMEQLGDRYYIRAEVTLLDEGKDLVFSTAYAREAAVKKGMDDAQITGSASSYARKYALNGLFAIDDTKDPDSTNTHGKEKQTADIL